MVVHSPGVEGKKVLREVSKGVVEAHFGVVFGVRSQFSSSQPAAGPDLPWDPCPLPLADWVERDSQQQEEGGSGPAQEGWLGWEPVSQSLEIRSPTVISFFLPSLFPTRKGLMLRSSSMLLILLRRPVYVWQGGSQEMGSPQGLAPPQCSLLPTTS